MQRVSSPKNDGQSQGSQSQSATPPSCTCEKCKQLIISDIDNDYSPLECSVCECYFHDSCLDFDNETAECLGSIVDIVGWVCSLGRSQARSQISASLSTSTRSKSSITAFKSLESDVAGVKTTCNLITNELVQSNLLNQPSQPQLLPQLQPIPDSGAGPRSWASLVQPSTSQAGHHLYPHPPQPPPKPPINTESVMRSVCNEMKDKERRKRNIIVSGMEPDVRYNDNAMFSDLCNSILGIDVYGEIDVKLSRRLPSSKQIHPLLIVFKREETANEILRYAKNLRESSDERIRTLVYINADLTPTEAKLAFEDREQRRARALVKQQTAAAATVSAAAAQDHTIVFDVAPIHPGDPTSIGAGSSTSTSITG